MKWAIHLIWFLLGVVVGMLIASNYIIYASAVAHDALLVAETCANELELLLNSASSGKEMWY